ncbi:hypothetical protein [Collimonas silvisoli]|uniref:hypothetical protein n=1 Tax=Collimonas silvisoli TaxID=2825884 RepID=UPI001B8D0E3C|nr:hypothetical protein [Collimonas silvisoli]
MHAIGAPSSPALSNILLYPLDEAINAKCVEMGITYTRYPAATQMSDEWVRPRLSDSVSPKVAEDIKDEGYDRWLILVGPDGKVEQITRLDGAANAISTIKP